VAEHLMIVEPDDATANGFILVNGSTSLTKIADADFVIPSSLAFLSGHFIVSEYDNDQFNLSDLYDGTAWDALQYATAESTRDKLIRIIVHNRQAWMLGERNTEVWWYSGASVPLDRIDGGILPYGCVGAFSACNQAGPLIWLDHQFQVRMAQGLESKVVSPRWVERELEGEADIWTAYAYQYTQKGHSFYCITTRAASKQWVYDITTGMWHTRTKCGSVTGTTCNSETKPSANCYAYYKGKHLVGDPSNGKIYEYDFDTYTDNSKYTEAIKQVYVPSGLSESYCDWIKLVAETGMEYNNGETSVEASILLKHSTDRGNSWTSEASRATGEDGETDKRIVWRRRGRSKSDWVFQIRQIHPVRRVWKELWGAFGNPQGTRLPLVSGANLDEIEELMKVECKNLYPFKISPESDEWALRGVPGLKEWADSEYSHEVRGMCVMDEYLYAVIGARLYRFNSEGTATYMNGDDDLDTATGHVFMENNTPMGDEYASGA
jgi:hypothetical protein